MYHTVLLGTDGRDPADRAVAHELSLGEMFDTDLVVLGSQGRTHSGDHIGSLATKVLRGIDRPPMLT
ncbi:hypothetical protein ACKVMT_02585 [Halobacteriales archaeon Cl-PHB]